MALQLWETLKEAITAYTGLSPATFFTVLALFWAIYYVVTGLFGSSNYPQQRSRALEEQVQPLPPPVQLGEITEVELKQYDGSDPQKPLLMAIKGQIYDVSQGRMFYGPGGPYALFAGKDASRALAKMSFEEKDLTGDISGLGPFELDALQDWEYRFMSKYVKVGTIKKTVPVSDGDASGEAVEVKEQDAEKPAEVKEQDAEKPAEGKEQEVEKPAEGEEQEVEKPAEGEEQDVEKPAKVKEPDAEQPAEVKEPDAEKPAEGKERHAEEPAEGKEQDVEKPAEVKEPDAENPAEGKEQDAKKLAEDGPSDGAAAGSEETPSGANSQKG